MIKQDELEGYLSLSLKLKVARDKIKLAEAKIFDQEKQLLTRLGVGEKVESGVLIAYVKEEQGRASVKWKELLQEVKGAAYVEMILQQAPRPIVEKLVVEGK